MNKKYSDIRTKLQIVVDKKTDNELAHLTHYFQSHKNGSEILITYLSVTERAGLFVSIPKAKLAA